MTYKGKYPLKNPQKYKGNKNNIIFRSLWELRLFKYLDLSSFVTEWASEEVVVQYISPVDGKPHNYFVDIYAKIKNNDGKEKKYLIEVKPKKETVPPRTPHKNTHKYREEAKKFLNNMAKWESAKKFAERYGMEFVVLTEEDLFGKKNDK